MSWVRSGYCCQCGECCVGDPFGGAEGPPTVPGRCPLYRILGGKGHCVGHEPPNQHPYYLSGCNVWPTVPGHIADYPSCTYSFEWRDD